MYENEEPDLIEKHEKITKMLNMLNDSTTTNYFHLMDLMGDTNLPGIGSLT